MAVDTAPTRQERHGLIEKSRGILDKADAEEKRSLTTEERQEYDRMANEIRALKTKIDDDERRNDLERVEQEKVNDDKEEEGRRKAADKGEEKKTNPLDLAVYDSEYRTRQTDAYHRGFLKDWFKRGVLDEEEQRVTQVAGQGETGGYLYTSEQFLAELLRDVDDATMIRQISRKFQIRSADSLGVPTITTKMTDAEWTSELGQPNEGDIKLGKRALTPHPLAKEARVSKVLVRKAPDIVSIVRSELARVVAEAEENAMMLGDGSQKPLGVFVVSDDGITTARDVSTGNTATLVKFDGLKNAKNTLKQAYWGNATWVMHRDVFNQLSKEKDGVGRYLMQDSVVAGEPDRLLSFPVILSEYAPSTLTAEEYVAILGDFRNYWIVDGLDTEVTLAQELLTRTNQDLFIIRAMMDAAPVRPEAFVRVQLTA